MAKLASARPEQTKSVTTTQSLKATPAVITRTTTDTTVTLSRAQYREFADLCKAHAGKPLNLTSLADMGEDWGRINYWALPAIDDVSQPDSDRYEQAYVYLTTRINTGAFRVAGRNRPECDWSKLKNSEIFQFIVWHEIGHFRDNFSPIEAFFSVDPKIEAIRPKLTMVNEVLADRFAWAHIRPGESMPLTEYGKANADAIERDIEMIGKVMTRAKYKLKPLETGQYRNVPAYMLSSKRKAAYVGPDIDPSLLAREVEYYREYFNRHGRHMEGVAL